MRKYKNWTLLSFMVLIIIAALIGLFMWSHMSNSNNKSTEEVYKNIETMYGGEIKTFKNNGTKYEMELSKNGAVYYIEVESKDGKILQMKRIDLAGIKQKDLISKKKLQKIIKENYQGKISRIILYTGQNTPIYQVQINQQHKKLKIHVDATTGEVLSETLIDSKTDNSIINKKEAEKIAKKKLNGTIQSATYFETSNGGYYLVEIETKGKVETFQIHAVSGKIMSITSN
ncbi:PepSY domain-containing protein [Rummeliibacillus pycnus]|uniref:PepSY domain-containing protein n=1 Tax=Rummeliibacillus pycnus TaxID=101070 RepID=UPI00147413F2|nr:PepSY domain-containing protein [Rummeliibacillus pycnus]